MKKLVYLTSIRYPAATAAHSLQTFEMAKEFNRALGDDFLFIVSKNDSKSFYGLNFLETDCEKYKPFHLVTPFYFFWLKKFLKNKKTDDYVFYLKDQKLAVLLALIKRSFGFKYKIAVEYHNHYGVFFDRLICRSADFILPLTDKAREFLISNYAVPENRFLVAPDAVNINEFDIEDDKMKYRKDLQLPEDKKLVGYVGTPATLGLEKGIKDIFEAAKLTGAGDIVFYIVGLRPKEAKRYERAVTDLKLENKVRLIGYQPRSAIPKYLKSFDVLLLPFPDKPHFSIFMSPLKLFEYMASRRPIVSSDLPSVREILSDEDALFVRPGSPEELAGAVSAVLDDDALAEKAARNSFEKVHTHTWAGRAKKIIDFIYA